MILGLVCTALFDSCQAFSWIDDTSDFDAKYHHKCHLKKKENGLHAQDTNTLKGVISGFKGCVGQGVTFGK